tara:strand:+ start:71 stop:409 length:339 start_codon:yes stop_codon:yes gene_type:complete
MKMYKPNAYDFTIIVSPILDKQSNWTGEVGLKIAMDNNNPLNDDDFEGMVNFTRQICASVPLMEENKMFRDATEQIANKHLPVNELLGDKELTVEDNDGNVIHVDFNPRTKH